jgi:hypothetical protein
LADKSTQLILDALSRAAADPSGVPLYGGKTAPGLLPRTAAGKQGAQRCKDEGWLHTVRTKTKGKTVVEWCALTEKGLNYLLSQVNPRHVLEDLVRALEARQAEVGQLVAAAQETKVQFAGLAAVAEKALQLLPSSGPPVPGWRETILDHLARWQQTRATEDCPLPELYQEARQAAPALTIGHFHDGLRQLHDQQQIYLHPWTGPLYEIPEPPYALLVGHEIAYYASRRCA